jgi:hypothetical protein
MERSEMIQKLNEATVMLGEMEIPGKYVNTIGLPVYAALQRVCEVGTELKKQEEAAHADDHDKQGD